MPRRRFAPVGGHYSRILVLVEKEGHVPGRCGLGLVFDIDKHMWVRTFGIRAELDTELHCDFVEEVEEVRIGIAFAITEADEAEEFCFGGKRGVVRVRWAQFGAVGNPGWGDIERGWSGSHGGSGSVGHEKCSRRGGELWVQLKRKLAPRSQSWGQESAVAVSRRRRRERTGGLRCLLP